MLIHSCINLCHSAWPFQSNMERYIMNCEPILLDLKQMHLLMFLLVFSTRITSIDSCHLTMLKSNEVSQKWIMSHGVNTAFYFLVDIWITIHFHKIINFITFLKKVRLSSHIICFQAKRNFWHYSLFSIVKQNECIHFESMKDKAHC